ncbi:MAG: acyl-CoA dehydrogenase family protein [Myxococcota bacterium]|jgi:alkylation response protein AidB-like acyl-CoA dehydrogenase|nr:acyl-CoA dehydrogenase family protein [Myxococcota bacterium]
MDLELTETQTIFRDTIRKFLEEEVPFSRVRELEKQQRSDEALWATLGAQGWLGVALPEEADEGGLIEAGLLVEEVQRRAALVPVAEAISCAVTLQRHGSRERAPELVERILSGEMTVVPAILESVDRFGEVAAEVNDDGLLSGEKFFVDYASIATHHLVAAQCRGAVGLYLVDRGQSQIETTSTPTLGRTPAAHVRYQNASAEQLCGEDGHAFLIQFARVLCAVQALSCMQVALEMSVAYTSIREQFGQLIGTFQAVQHHAADMAIDTESTRFLVYETLDALDRGEASEEQVAVAKAAASRAVPEVVMLAQQLHGGQGFIEENDLYFFTLRGKERSLAWGTTEECLALIGRSVEAPERWL